MNKYICPRCNKIFFDTDKRKYCSRKCHFASGFSEERKKRISEAHKGIKLSESHKNALKEAWKHRDHSGYWLGKKRGPMPKKWKDKISKANKGKKLSKEHIEMIRNRMIGSKMSIKTREKLRESHLGQPSWNKGIKCPSISKKMIGNKNHQWKGGRIIKKGRNSYIHIKNRSHPFAVNGYVPEHRLVMEKHLGRYLTRKEVVHHINENTFDNRIENLHLFKNNSEHTKHHRMLKKLRAVNTP